jgi:Fe-S cluster assembly protein SufD
MSERATAENLFLQDFAANAATLPGSGTPWLDARRARAITSFRAAGVPHRRIEEWKYSDLRNALEARAGFVARDIRAALVPDPFAAVAGARLVISDGSFSAALSQADALPEGVELVDLARLDRESPDWIKRSLGEVLAGGAMGAASFALMRGGVALRVTGDVPEPIHLQFLQRAEAAHSRVLIVMEQGASLSLLESHGDNEAGLANIGMEIVLNANAVLTHARLADIASGAVQVEEIGVTVARDARYRGHFSQKGAKLSRVELAISLEGEGSEAELSGASVLSGHLHADVTTHIDHAVGKTASRQLFKKVAGGHSRAVYQGKITVREGANGSDSRQTAKALLLGARAEADLKPELEIFADDVKCAHGAAIGDLDADSLFYLRSRGIPEMEARTLLIRGFLEEPISEIAQEDLRMAVWAFVESGLADALETPP